MGTGKKKHLTLKHGIRSNQTCPGGSDSTQYAYVNINKNNVNNYEYKH